VRLVVATLLAVVGGLLAPAALLAWDAQGILLDTDRWVETSAPVIEDPAARTALATVVVDRASAQLACNGGLVGLAAGRLGTRARAGAIAKLEEQLATDRARVAWRDANRDAHAEFVRAARSDTVALDDRLLDAGKLVELAAGAVVVLRHADELLDGGDQGAADPCGRPALAMVDGDGLRAAGLAARALEVASWLPTALAAASVALLLLALLVARRRTLALATWVAVAGALAVAGLLLRATLVDRLVDDIGSNAARELAAIVLDQALDAPEEHLRLVAVGAGVVMALVATAAVIAARRREPS
jgi:hypothetical protein